MHVPADGQRERISFLFFKIRVPVKLQKDVWGQKTLRNFDMQLFSIYNMAIINDNQLYY